MLVYQRHKNYRVTFSRPRLIVDVLEVDTDSIRKTKKKYDFIYICHRDDLNDCSTKFIDIQKDTKAAGKYKIVVVPTLVIYRGNEEVARFQANIMMQMEATKKEVQEKIDEIIMSDF